MKTKYTDIVPNREWAILHAKKRMDEIVFRYTVHEGLPFTFPEVKTVLEGYSVGGKKLFDIDTVIRIGLAVEKTIQLVENNQFSINKETSNQLHAILMKDDAIDFGNLRNLQVGVAAGGNKFMPPRPEELDKCFQEMIDRYNADERHTVDKSFEIFVAYAKNQYYMDGNKRMGQLMMNGNMIDNGYFWTSIPETKRLSFNQALTDMYMKGNENKLKKMYIKELEHFYSLVAPKTKGVER